MSFGINLLILIAIMMIKVFCSEDLGTVGLTIKPIEESHSAPPDLKYHRKLISLPANYDFSTAFPSCNPSAKNKGTCGNDYAFTTSSVIELRRCRKLGVYVALSPQDLTSCDQHNNGCKGGNGLYSFLYGERYGLRTEACSPYSDEYKMNKISFTSACRLNCFDLSRNNIRYFCKKGTSMTVDFTDDVKNEIYLRGPVFLLIHSYQDFSDLGAHITPYKAATSSNSLLGTHSVTLIGWGTTGTVDYWLILNSWSTSWGNKGKAMIDKTDTLTLPSSLTYVSYCIIP